MKKIILAGTLICSIGLLAACGNNQPIVIDGKNYSPDNTITVVGTGSSKMKADTGYLYVDVEVEKNNSKDAQQVAAKTMDDVYKSLRKLGIKKDEVETVNYSMNVIKDYYGNQPPYQIKAYKVENSIKVTIADLEKVSEVIDAVNKSTYVSIDTLAFGLEDSKKAESEAVVDATSNAKEKAEAIAKNLNVKINGIKSVEIVDKNQESHSYDLPYNSDSGATKSSSTPISAKNIEIERAIEVKFLVQ